MDKIPDSVINSIKRLIEHLDNDNIKIKEAILFGSYAKGTFTELSDIDLALVSDSFSGNRFQDKEKIRKAILSVNSDISPLPFNTEDFIEDDLFVSQILKEGIRIS